MAYIGVSPSNGVRQKHTYTATASQTTFSGAGAEGVSLSYRDSNYVDVYVNGVKLGDADYTATSGTSINFDPGLPENDIVEVIVYDVFSVADTVSKADGGVFDGNVTMAGNLSVDGNLDVTGSLDMSDANLTNVGSIQLDSISGDADTNTSITFSGSDVITVATGGSTAFTVDASQDVNLSGSLTFADNEKAIFGDGSDFEIRHNSATGENQLNLTSNPLEMKQLGANSVLQLINGGTNHNQVLQILKGSTLHGSISTDTNKLKIDGIGSLELSDDGSTKLATTSTGIQVTGNIANASGNFTLDVAGDIILDADGKDYLFKDAGTLIATMSSDNTDFTIRSEVLDRDLKFEGNDGGAVITALTLDMSDAGTAVFNNDVKLATDNAILNIGNDDDIALTHDGTNGSLTSGGNFLLSVGTELTLDAGGDITLDADGAQIRLKDGGTQFGLFGNESSDFLIQSSVLDKDIIFQGNDGGVGVTALRLDISDAGTAIFNHDIKLSADAIIDCGGNLRLDAESANIIFQDTGTAYGKIFKSSDDFVIKSEINHGDIIFQGFYNGSTITALTLNMGIDGTAQFKDKIQCTSINTGSSTGSLTMFGGGTNKGGTIELSGGNNTGSTGSGIVFKTGASTSSPSEKMRIDQYGHVTMPYQSAFRVDKNNSDQNNFANDGGAVTVTFSTARFDQNSDFDLSNNQFVAPVTGKYLLTISMRINNVDTAPTYYIATIETSNNSYHSLIDPNFSSDLDYKTFTVTVVANMDASDTASIKIRQSGGSVQSDVDGSSAYTYFTGALLC